MHFRVSARPRKFTDWRLFPPPPPPLPSELAPAFVLSFSFPTVVDGCLDCHHVHALLGVNRMWRGQCGSVLAGGDDDGNDNDDDGSTTSIRLSRHHPHHVLGGIHGWALSAHSLDTNDHRSCGKEDGDVCFLPRLVPTDRLACFHFLAWRFGLEGGRPTNFHKWKDCCLLWKREEVG